MWPDISDSDTPRDDSISSDSLHLDPSHSPRDTPSANLQHNLGILNKRPLDKQAFSNLRESVRKDMSNIQIDTGSPQKKVKIKKIVWDPETKTTPQEAEQTRQMEDLRSVITRKLKRLRVDGEMQDGMSPFGKRRVIVDYEHTSKISQTWVSPNKDERSFKIPKRNIKPDPDPPETPPSDSNRKILQAKKYVRKCRLCGQEIRNLRSHLAFNHLEDTWWGVIGDLTCWTCFRYHVPSDITCCGKNMFPFFIGISFYKDMRNSLIS